MSGPDQHSRTAQVTGTLLAVAIPICGALPTFLTSALAVQLQDDLDFGPAALGLATSVSFGMGGATSHLMGAMVQRRGSRFGFQAAVTLSTLALLLVISAPSYPFLVVGLAVAGLGNSIAQPCANLMISEMVGRRRLGLAMGFKQSYIPIASLLGGLAVPIVAVQYGWRWAMVGAAVFCVVTLFAGRVRTRPGTDLADDPITTGDGVAAPPAAPTGASAEPDTPPLSRRAIRVLTLGGGLAAGSITALGVFLVDASVDAGVDPAAAGYLLAFCAALCLAGRVSAGWLADRFPRRSLYLASANIIGLGAGGLVLLAFGTGWVFVVGAVLGYLGWTWPGLYHLAVMRDSPRLVAAATGTVQAGFAGGAALGPLFLGLLVEASSYRVAWLVTAAIAALGVVVVRWARRIIRHERGLPVGRHQLRTGLPTAG